MLNSIFIFKPIYNTSFIGKLYMRFYIFEKDYNKSYNNLWIFFQILKYFFSLISKTMFLNLYPKLCCFSLLIFLRKYHVSY